MLAFIGIIIVALASIAYGAENPFAECKIQGDPRLAPFPHDRCASLVLANCALRNSPVIFFYNKYIKIEVFNSGGSIGNIISFIVSLFDKSDSDDDVCTFTELYFKISARNYACGLTNISINTDHMQIHHQEADLLVTIYNGYSNYNIDLTTSWENVNTSKGMCRDGCTNKYASNVRSFVVRPVPQDQTISLLAEQICDVYLTEYTKPNASIPIDLIPFVETARQGCITDLTTMGDKRYAEQALISIASTVITANATSLEQIQNRMQQATALADQVSKIADQITTQLIADHKAKNSVTN